MIEYLMLVGGLIAGALIYFALYESVEEHMNMKLNKNIFFAIFVLIVLVFGVFVAEQIQLTERANQNSNGQQKVGIYTCITENTATCNTIVNKINNDNYAELTAGKVQTVNLYIGFSLLDTIVKNVFTYFCIGILFIWASVSLYSLKQVKE